MRLELKLLEQSEHRLVLGYGMTNERGREVFLLDQLPLIDESGACSLDANRVYVEIAGAELRLSRQLVQVPEQMVVEAPEVPFLTRLEAGDSIEQQLVVELPAEPFHPYAPPVPADAEWQTRSVEGVSFHLGYLTPLEDDWIRQVEIDGQPVSAIDHGLAVRVARVVSSNPLVVRCSCRDSVA